MNQYSLLKIIFNTLMEMYPQANQAYECSNLLKKNGYTTSYKGGSSFQMKVESEIHPHVSEIVVSFNQENTMNINFIKNNKIGITFDDENQCWAIHTIDENPQIIKTFYKGMGEYPYNDPIIINNMDELSEFLKTF